ncbi:MAG: hypothetical protein HY788_07120 [Deltaproteobacteria bacterium]|nr:hypothetical protein [Deltaproteobacteria bacterium]
MSFLGNYLEPRPEKATLKRTLIVGYVRQLFKRPDFPRELFVALADSAMVNKGDVVWASLDAEHPFDFIPLPSFDQLVLNLPEKEEFLKKLGVEKMEDVSPEAERQFWEDFDFEFGSSADCVELIWE